jgi:Domain of unknown function (DUF397)
MRTGSPRFTDEGWFKASASNDNGTGCVEVNLSTPGLVGVRDSKKPEAGTFAFDTTAWRGFLDVLRGTTGSA